VSTLVETAVAARDDVEGRASRSCGSTKSIEHLPLPFLYFDVRELFFSFVE
jgi:hypothetical protein